MKAIFFASITLALAFAAQANETAYTALRVVGKSRGEDTLKHVLELRGRAGMPQPAVWKVVIDDPRARGGIREFDVERGKIIGERAPTGRTAGGPMTLTQLNLDSEGAFTVANQEGQKANVQFDHIDYVLRSGSGGGAPVWELELSNGKDRVGSIVIGADSGNILRQQFDRGHIAASGQQDDHEYLEGRSDATGGPHPAGREGDTGRVVGSFFTRVGRHFERRGRQIENFFTGKRSDE